MGTLVDGCVLAVLGQGVVFLFLGLMVALIGFLARLSRLTAAAAAPVPAPSPAAVAQAEPGTTTDGDIAAVVAVAVHRFRRDRRP